MANNSEKKLPLFRILTLVLSCGVFLFAASRLYAYYRENHQGDEAQSRLADQAVTVVTPAAPPETAPLAPEETRAAEETRYPDISYEIPIRVDFDVLQAENPDIIAWLYCADTPINYPVVQGENNDYYLHRLPDGTQNVNGSLFMDFRNLRDFSDRNSVIYGHNMTSDAMFGSLEKYKKQSYFDEHPRMWLLTPERAYRMDLVAGVVTPSDSDAYTLFDSDEELLSHLEAVVEDSTFVSGVDLSTVERIVTLSTCSYEYATARYVVIGSLLPAEYPPGETAF